MLREPLLESDEYVTYLYHIVAKIHKLSNIFLTLREFFAKTISIILAAKKKSRLVGVDPEYLKKQKESLVRKHRQVIYLNDSEMAAIRAYCDKFRVNTKAVLFREAIMEKVLSELDDNHPTLF